MAEGAVTRVCVLYSPAPREVFEWEVALAPGETVLQALRASGLSAAFPDLDLHDADVGVWQELGQVVDRHHGIPVARARLTRDAGDGRTQRGQQR